VTANLFLQAMAVVGGKHYTTRLISPNADLLSHHHPLFIPRF
jgi:hypothetical protein